MISQIELIKLYKEKHQDNTAEFYKNNLNLWRTRKQVFLFEHLSNCAGKVELFESLWGKEWNEKANDRLDYNIIVKKQDFVEFLNNKLKNFDYIFTDKTKKYIVSYQEIFNKTENIEISSLEAELLWRSTHNNKNSFYTIKSKMLYFEKINSIYEK